MIYDEFSDHASEYDRGVSLTAECPEQVATLSRNRTFLCCWP